MKEQELTYPLYAISRLRMQTDGNGITSLIASSGCPLCCKYCLNPECRDGSKKIKNVTIDELYDKVKIDNLYFITTNGGVTFGGGEPLLYADFISQFIMKYKSTGWHFNVETSLNIQAEKLMKVINLIDAFSVDCKDMDPVRYNKYTDGDYSLFESNLRLLIKKIGPEKFRVRVPYIMGYNTRKEQLENERKLKDMGVKHIQLFDYIVSPKSS